MANARRSSTDFNPRPPRGGRLTADVVRKYKQLISIHALREEGDRMWSQISFHSMISIHALREEGDSLVRYTLQAAGLFQSTPSARRATGVILHP